MRFACNNQCVDWYRLQVRARGCLTHALWNVLVGERNLAGELPHEQRDLEDFHDPHPGTPGCACSRRGSFLDDPFDFDSTFLSFDGNFGVCRGF